MFRSTARSSLRPATARHGKRYASIHEFKRRIQVVESVEKITSSMKMVAAAKLKIAQARVEPAVAFNDSNGKVLEGLGERDEETVAALNADAEAENSPTGKHLVVVVTTDRGLCGAVTGNAVRRAIEESNALGSKAEVAFCSVGTKGGDALVGQGKSDKISMVVAELGAKPPTFTEVAYVADTLLSAKPASITLVYNHFINLLSNEMRALKQPSMTNLRAALKWQEVEFDDEDCFQSLSEFSFASALWAGIMDNATVEQAVRMTAMDGASSNAGDLVKDLLLQYNKTRQQVITTELSEIVSGAAAISEG